MYRQISGHLYTTEIKVNTAHSLRVPKVQDFGFRPGPIHIHHLFFSYQIRDNRFMAKLLKLMALRLINIIS
jgi:hypothetical protein